MGDRQLASGRVATVGGLVARNADSWADRRAYVFLADGEAEHSALTYAELHAATSGVASLVREYAHAGDRALLVYPTSLSFAVAFLACARAGVVNVPVSQPGPSRVARAMARFGAIAADASPTVGLTTAALLPLMKQLSAETPALARLPWVATDVPLGVPDGRDMGEPRGDSLALLQYTSGSTASPRGVKVTHANLLENMAMVFEGFEFDGPPQVVTWLPLFHDMGLIGTTLVPLLGGGTTTMMPPLAFLQRPARWLHAITRYRADTSGGPNFAYDLCVQKIRPEERESLDLRAWRVAFNGAEPVRADTLERFVETFAPHGLRRETLYPCYGLAEATLIVAGVHRHEPATYLAVDGAALERHAVVPVDEGTPGSRVLVGCGRPLGAARVVIVDPETRAERPDDHVGEIWVTGPTVSGGYWGHEQASEEMLRATLVGDAGGAKYLRTGDLGFVRDGQLYVTGRIKDLVIVRGRNHYPQDIERTVEDCHPGVRRAGVAAFTIDVDGEERLVVVSEVDRAYLGGRTAVPGGLVAIEEAIRQSIAVEHELRVHTVRLISPGRLLKTSSGKVRRQACRAAFLSNTLDALAIEGIEAIEGSRHA